MVAVVVASGFAACTGLPSSSGVLAGRNVDERVAPQARVVVPPPAAGAAMEAVALGFIRAGAAFQEADTNHEPVGNSYLAATSVDRWRPTSQVTVFDRDASLAATVVAPTQVKVSTQAVAVIDAGGRYRELAPQTPVEAVFDLVQVQGEWRVSLPEKRLWHLGQHRRLRAALRRVCRDLPDCGWTAAGSRRALVRDRTATGHRLGPRPARRGPGVPQWRGGVRSPGGDQARRRRRRRAEPDRDGRAVQPGQHLRRPEPPGDVGPVRRDLDSGPGGIWCLARGPGPRTDRRPGCPGRRHISRPGRVQHGGCADRSQRPAATGGAPRPG